MSSPHRAERRLIQEAGGPLAGHSMNQHVMRRRLHGERLLHEPTKKEIAARRRLERELGEKEIAYAHDKDKLARIAGRVWAAKLGWEGSDPSVLAAEQRFLEKRGIRIKTPDEKFLTAEPNIVGL